VTEGPYNPLDKINLGKSVAEALLDRPSNSLGEIPQFDGAGIYAIYYSGDFEPYRPMAERNAQAPEWPIYIGKAIPSGGRKGAAVFSAISGQHLWKRLREHADTVRAASNLKIEQFTCRYLIVDDIWIPLGETLLIAHFKPVWNLALDGFGNHDPGAGRYSGQRPVWDVLHPGRAWAERCADRIETSEGLANRVSKFLASNPPPVDPHMQFDPLSKL
jgi:hypothetical protein